ncbi:MAG: cytochrome c biogenesis protein ResB, partial [Bacteroidales bacterium]|nr:cytochrome c biogenesis protein ResB [Bacteroidales bacterium]
LPVTIELQSFDIRYHEISDLNHLEQAVPRQYIARVKILDRRVEPPRVREDSILVNRPLRAGGFHIYNTSFDPYGQGYVTFLLVKDPWRGATYAGIGLCLAGGLLLFIQKSRKRPRYDELA